MLSSVVVRRLVQQEGAVLVPVTARTVRGLHGAGGAAETALRMAAGQRNAMPMWLMMRPGRGSSAVGCVPSSASNSRLLQRALSTKSEKEAAAETSSPEGEAAGNEGEGEGKVEPKKGTVVQGIKTVTSGIMVLGVLALVGAAGYYVFRELMPTSMSVNSLFNRASDAVCHNPEVVHRMGNELKSYGVDNSGRREGRRFNVPEYRYEKKGVKYLRIMFTVEGERGMQGRVFAEISDKDPHRFHYLMVQMNGGEVIVIEDNRQPEKPRNVRQADVGIALQAARAVMYGNGSNAKVLAQKRELGEAFQYLKFVDCDTNPTTCDGENIVEQPTLKVEGSVHKGFLSLDKLEDVVSTLRTKSIILDES